MCEFTGTSTESDATPGRCTKTAGYLAYAELTEILKKRDNVQLFYDGASNSDIMLYDGSSAPIVSFARRYEREPISLRLPCALSFLYI